MKKPIVILLTVVLSCLIAAAAWAQHAHHPEKARMGPREKPTQKLPPETEEALRAEQAKHAEETAALRRSILVKQHEMAAIFLNPASRLEDLLKKHKELQEIQNELEEQNLTFRWNLSRKYPETATGMMGGCMMGGGMMGHGPAAGCMRGRGMMGGAGQ